MLAFRPMLSAAAAAVIGGGALVALPSTALAAPATPAVPVVINEAVSTGGVPDDWIEFRNLTAEPVDLGGYVVQDDSDKNPYTFPAGTVIAPHGYLVLDTVKNGAGDFDFGLGKADSVRLFAPDGALVEERSWTAHGAPSWARTETGEWALSLDATKGGKNRFAGDPVWVSGNLVINEAESSGGVPGDWIEFANIGTKPVDASGYIVKDDKDDNSYTLPAGTVVEPGEFLVIDELLKSGTGDFDFGLGKADAVRLFEPDGTTLVDARSWTEHAAHTYGRDAAGEWRETAEATKGAANVFAEDIVEPVAPALVLNEIDSAPADWLEFVNPGDEALDISGYEIRDNSDDHRWRFPAGTTIAAGEFLVVDAKQNGLIWDQATSEWVQNTFEAAIGIGSNDAIRVYDAAGALLDEHAWQGHAAIDGDELAATLARCPDAVGAFALAHATKGAANECVPPAVVINEIESNGGTPGDWAEIKNVGATAVDISGWTLMDNDPVGHATAAVPLPAGTVIEPGAYFVFDENAHFGFGLGKADSVVIRDAHGTTVAEHSWTEHAAGVYARCPDGSGEFVDVDTPTRGALNACGNAVVVNEVESKDGEPGDWIELHNPTAAELDVSGLVVKDDDDAHAYEIPAGTVIAAGGYLVIEEAELGFGLGGADAVRVFDGELLIQQTSWTSHAATTWGRCPNATGEFAVTAASTKGARNECPGEVATIAWPGSGEISAVDDVPIFLEDSSGLDFVAAGDGGHLYAVDNGTGTFWRLDVAADGALTMSDAWAPGKRVRFQADADNPAAAGPDAEGISVDGTGMVFIASERDNSAKGVNRNTVLMVDPEAAGPDVVATTQWELTELLPAVSPNTGIETIEWIADDVLAGAIWDDARGKPYDPADYPDRRAGLYLVGVEADGLVRAFALADDGSATLVSTLDPKLGAVMALDYDPVLGVLWAMCDDGCDGLGAQIALQPLVSAELAVVHVERPGAMPNVNNEGFATSTICVAGERSVWWFEDGVKSNALRTSTLPCDATAPEEPGTEFELVVALDRASARVGEEVTATATGAKPGELVAFELRSEPVALGEATADADGTATLAFAVPEGAAPGDHSVVATGAESGASASAPLAVTAAADEPGATQEPGTEEPGATQQPGTDAPGTDQPAATQEPGTTPIPTTADEATGAPTSDASGLAATGARDLTWILVLGGVLIVAGAALFLFRRRRGADEAEPVDAPADAPGDAPTE